MKTGTCKHFNGIVHDRCQLGVLYDRFRRPGAPVWNTFPCFGKCDGCDKREYPSQEELDAYEKETEVAIQAAIALDNAMSSGESSGSFTHEVCGGTINWVRQGPLSARAKCDTCEWSAIS